MVSYIARSFALVSLFSSPTLTVAFTTPRRSPTTSSSKSVLRAAAANDHNSPQRQPLATSSQENELSGLSLPLSSSLNSLSPQNDGSPCDCEPRSSEFQGLEPLLLSSTRRSRIEAEARCSNIYVPGGSNGYWELCDEIVRLEKDLESALRVDSSDGTVDKIKNSLRRARARDPEHVYKVTSGAARGAERMGKLMESVKYHEESMRARRMLPQFNLEGLWVGKYGSHGFEMVNITYSGDKLIAYKVTGDKNIPRGEISFTADLSPESEGHPSGPPPRLDPILLSETSAEKWGTKRLSRFHGRGHAAEPGFVNSQYLEGQLVVIGGGDYFSFAWVPLEHQIFFGRPSPELTIKMLRDGGGSTITAGVGLEVPGIDAGMREQMDYVSRCLEVTVDNCWDQLNEGKVDPFSCIWHGDEAEYCYFE